MLSIITISEFDAELRALLDKYKLEEVGGDGQIFFPTIKSNTGGLDDKFVLYLKLKSKEQSSCKTNDHS